MIHDDAVDVDAVATRTLAASTRAEVSLAVQAREHVWLEDVRRGYSVEEIARREGLSRRRVQLGVSRARERQDLSHIRDSSHHEASGMEDRGVGASAKGLVRHARERDREQLPRLMPIFPIGPFTPSSTCPHHGPIRLGSIFCCMVCNSSGMDDHPALKRDPQTDPKPEPKHRPKPEGKSSAKPEAKAIGRMSRQERRRLIGEAGPR